MGYDPLSPSEAARTPIGATLAALATLWLVYSVVIAAQLLLGLFGFLGVLSLYVTYRLFAAIDTIADAQQRLADAREREVDGAAADRPDAGAARDRTITRDRPTDRTADDAEATTSRVLDRDRSE